MFTVNRKKWDALGSLIKVTRNFPLPLNLENMVTTFALYIISSDALTMQYLTSNY